MEGPTVCCHNDCAIDLFIAGVGFFVNQEAIYEGSICLIEHQSFLLLQICAFSWISDSSINSREMSEKAGEAREKKESYLSEMVKELVEHHARFSPHTLQVETVTDFKCKCC